MTRKEHAWLFYFVMPIGFAVVMAALWLRRYGKKKRKPRNISLDRGSQQTRRKCHEH